MVVVVESSATVEGAGDEFLWPVRVYYEDTDDGGVVYYANYLKFMERARTEWIRLRGFEHTALRDEYGVFFAVSRLAIDYRQPARLDDCLRVGVKLMSLGRASLQLEQQILRAPTEVLCRAAVRIACLGARTLKPQALPSVVAAELKRDP